MESNHSLYLQAGIVLVRRSPAEVQTTGLSIVIRSSKKVSEDRTTSGVLRE